MKSRWSVQALLAIIVAMSVTRITEAQFFIGSPTASFNTTSGTITSTPTTVANNPNQEIDVNGQFDVTNATPFVQTASFDASCLLDPTFNGGSPLSIQLQINQSGFVVVPAGGQLYGWTLTAEVVDNTGVSVAGSNVVATWPASPFPYGPGTTTYGPTTTLGSTFTYNPATASLLTLSFSSNFDGLGGANVYTWDFPVSVKAVIVPEPASWGMLAFGALLLLSRRLLAKR